CADEPHPEHGRNTNDNYDHPADHHRQERERSTNDDYRIEKQKLQPVTKRGRWGDVVVVDG
nr:hypothetical protein [Myxococcota bacterium]